MSFPPDEAELSLQEMRAFLLKEHRSTIKRRRKRIILAVIIGLLVGAEFQIAWDHGVIASVSANIWNFICRISADWKWFLAAAFR
jgi:hypothetical protein